VTVYEPTAIVRHHHRDDDDELRRQFFGYGAAQGALCLKFVLERPGHRRQAIRFFLWRMGGHRRRLRSISAGDDQFPRALVAAEVRGQLAGPFLYLWSRFRAPR
jgi:O-antigen biosynthesis protein